MLANLDDALDLYGKMADFDPTDLKDVLTDVGEEVKQLPQRHSDLWALFKDLGNKHDEEAFERLLSDDALRVQFYERLLAYANTLKIALSTIKFIEETPDKKVEKYRSDLRFFMNLRSAVRKRYSEVVNFKEYEKKIEKLIDTHVGTGQIERITELVNIFDEEKFAKEVEKLPSKSSKADTIAYRTKKTITEKLDEDPAFYKRFSEMLNEAITAFRAKRLSDAEYLKKVTEVMGAIKNRTGDDLPPSLRHHEVAKAFYGQVVEVVDGDGLSAKDKRELAEKVALGIDEIVLAKKCVDWANNVDVQNQMKTAIEDRMFELKEEMGVALTFEEIDEILEKCLDIAKRRYAE